MLYKKPIDKPAKENKILASFSIAPSEKDAIENIFAEMGLSWSAGVRFALRNFQRKYGENR